MATDAEEAKALSHERDYIDIYSNSWGPGDKGFEVVGPDKLTQLVLKDGAEKVHLVKFIFFSVVYFITDLVKRLNSTGFIVWSKDRDVIMH